MSNRNNQDEKVVKVLMSTRHKEDEINIRLFNEYS